MGFFSFLSRQRDRYSEELRDNEKYWSLSALTLGGLKEFKAVIRKYARGKLLDAGAGSLNLRGMLEPFCEKYVSMDVSDARGQVDIIGDIQNMPQVGSDQFDSVFCSQVLEHVPQPWHAIAEFHRILKPGGVVIISVPHISGLHEEPHDYYRYTPYALRFLMKHYGFEVQEELRMGGLLGFLAHPVSFVLVLSVWPVFGIRWVVWWLNKLILIHPVLWLERLLRLDRKFPANLVIVAKKI